MPLSVATARSKRAETEAGSVAFTSGAPTARTDAPSAVNRSAAAAPRPPVPPTRRHLLPRSLPAMPYLLQWHNSRRGGYGYGPDDSTPNDALQGDSAAPRVVSDFAARSV